MGETAVLRFTRLLGSRNLHIFCAVLPKLVQDLASAAVHPSEYTILCCTELF
jgi:hypothetical protein